MRSASVFRTLLALFGVSLCISISATEICAGLFLMWWLIDSVRLRESARWRCTPQNKPLLIFFLWSVVCVAVVRPRDVWSAVSAPSALALFYWASQCLENDDVETLMKWICIGAAVAGVWGVLQAASGIKFVSAINGYEMPERFRSWPVWALHYSSLHNDRAMGSRSHPLTYSECLMPGFFLLLYFGQRAWKERARKTGLLLAIVCGLAGIAGGMIASQSRGVWAGVSVGFVVYAMMLGRRFFISTLAIGAVAAGVLFAAAPSSVKGRLLSVVSSQAGSVGDQWSKQTRYELWTQAWEQVKAHPFMGVGFDGVALRVKQPMDPEPRIWTETHNIYLQDLLETGLIGFGLFIWVLFIGARMFAEVSMPLRPALLGLCAAFLVAGLTESWTHDKEVAMLFWLLIGCAAALRPHEPR